MIPAIFVKTYDSISAAVAARAHHQWLQQLDSGIRIPKLHPSSGFRLEFEHLHGHQPTPSDLPAVSAALGQLHATAHRRALYTAELDQPYEASPSLTLADFISPRRHALQDIHELPNTPAALYKDCNIRNVIITATGVAIVDFDDLTLAPFGYDLAKLVVSAAMTHGRIEPTLVRRCLDTYNTTIAAVAHAECDIRRFQLYTEIHHQLTAHYLGHHGYRHSWTDVRTHIQTNS